MEFRIALVFLFLYYIRPQDWVQALIGFNIIRPLMVAWIAALMSRRERSPLSGVLRTPHDWVMLSYFVYVVWNAPDSQATFSGFLPSVVFYALTVQSLTDWERIRKYLQFWNLMLLGVAAIAVASRFGLDITGAVDMTAKNAGRLSIGTWLCDNPNSLAHTVVAAIPLSYLLYFWKGSAGMRLCVFPLCAFLAGLCAYYTESKGSYLVAGGLVVLIFVIGRPWGVKALALAVAGVVGVSALSFLPRMEQMGSLRSDEGVQGRLMAWEMARHALEKSSTGEGWRQFVAMITWEGETFAKATHSSYVQIGADLGMYGIFLYVAGLWCAGHSLSKAHRLTVDDDNHERCRRISLILLLANAVSGWMINREYHTEYFLLIAVAASIHRLCQVEDDAAREILSESEHPDSNLDAGDDGASASVQLATRLEGGNVMPSLAISSNEQPTLLDTPPYWRRLGILDIAASAALTWIVIEIWDYVLTDL